ncbi:MAG: LLM class F420-dependent oxidoreductase [Proteobacteria bacterium]|nr:MAG: LLM class F420-dependent oxidoreductase [Pseudomonadota bacterium]
MKVDGAILVDDPRDAGPLARRLEAAGYDGAFTFEGRHDPFLPLAVAAEHTERMELATAIAVAFARGPMTLAQLGYDLQLHSRGRFVLGLGSQIRAHVERRFGAPWSRPAARMREAVQAIRAIWRSWHEGAPLDFRGEFFRHTLMTPVFDPGPNPFGLPPIFVAGVGPKMTEVAGEVADGYFVHPFHTPASVERVTLPALRRGFDRAGRSADGFTVSCQLIVATGDGDEAIERARQGAKAQISFYASTPAYRPVLDCHGRGELQEELNALSKRGAWLEMVGRVDDALLDEVAVVGHRREIAAKIASRCEGFADRVSLVAPFAPDPDLWADVVRELRAITSSAR